MIEKIKNSLNEPATLGTVAVFVITFKLTSDIMDAIHNRKKAAE